jgi:hypothetical protein
MSRPSPSAELPDRPLDDERAEALRQSYLREQKEDEERDFESELDIAWSEWSV